MWYVVEIQDGTGKIATKEYEAMSPRELMGRVQRDLQPYPNVWFVGAWEKGHPTRSIFFDTQRQGEVF